MRCWSARLERTGCDRAVRRKIRDLCTKGRGAGPPSDMSGGARILAGEGNGGLEKSCRTETVLKTPRWYRQIISAHNEIHLIYTAARKERLRFA